MSTHAVASSRKPKNLLKSFITATAAVWFFTSDDSECKYVPPTPQAPSVPIFQSVPTESSSHGDKLHNQRPSTFLGRPLTSFKSESSTNSISTYYRPSKLLPIHNPATGMPLHISGSVYSREFHELEKLGSGGFGTVFRSQNLLDGNTYAIKKIFLPLSTPKYQQLHLNRCSNTLDPFMLSDDIRISLREPQIMAAVCKHRNIVQYHHSWLEIVPNWQNDGDLLIPSLSASDSLYPPSPPEIPAKIHEDSDWTDGYGSEDDAQEIMENSETTANSSDYSLILFIQMELCDGASLYDWLRLPGRVVDAAENTRLFRQLIRGLSHLHAKNYCHRDVKPSNLLIVPKGGRNTLKVGDFGCCKRLQTERDSSDNFASFVAPLASSAPSDHEHTQGCGTFFYMAPELHTRSYNTSVDIFAAGVVLFELFHVFATETERIQLLTLLHEKRLVPRTFIREYPIEASLVLKMTHADPSMRPTAFELLNDPRYGLCPVQELDSSLLD